MRASLLDGNIQRICVGASFPRERSLQMVQNRAYFLQGLQISVRYETRGEGSSMPRGEGTSMIYCENVEKLSNGDGKCLKRVFRRSCTCAALNCLLCIQCAYTSCTFMRATASPCLRGTTYAQSSISILIVTNSLELC